MRESTFPQDSLVVYKKQPARVRKVGERIEIEIEGGNLVKVRPKDIELLHPGPIHSLKDVVGQVSHKQEGDVELTWQILVETGGFVNFPELVELIYGVFDPINAWLTWQQVEDGLLFLKSPKGVRAQSPEDVSRESTQRQIRAAEAQNWEEFLARARKGQVHPSNDGRFLHEIEDLAYGRRKNSRLLNELGRSERPETAHASLLEWGYWDAFKNPYPSRFGLSISLSERPIPDLLGQARLDLTAISAFAIDDQGNKDPDDALSLISCQFDENGQMSNGRIWVHIADPAALAPPNSPLDLEARLRGATFYLPEGTVPMFPNAAIHKLGLGLQEISPALSIEIEIDPLAQVKLIQIKASWVRVQRLSYEQVEGKLEDQPFRNLHCLTQAYQTRRQANNALNIDLPEAIFHVVNGEISIHPIQRLRSRDMVREAMLMAGEATARFAIEQHIPFPFAVQNPPDLPLDLLEKLRLADASERLSTGFAMRRFLKRSQVSCQPAPHSGLGLPVYSRMTSPLRRYLDLVAHQQLHAHLSGDYPLGEQVLLERIAEAESISAAVAQAESFARRHWTLVYLQQHPEWRGQGVLVEINGLRGTVILPELALESRIHLREELPLDSQLQLQLRGVNLPELEAHFVLI